MPGRPLHRTRWRYDVDDQQTSIDVFEGPLEGLITMEVDLGEPEFLGSFYPPSWVGADVTDVEAFTGGALAGCSFPDIADLVGSSATSTQAAQATSEPASSPLTEPIDS
ncbi:MAG: CYTH domain-containing protein [Candidatus Poriferisodalaceae bacterium]|jgi:CYTH domain-containing protein